MVLFLLACPLVVAGLLLLLKNHKAAGAVTCTAAAVIAALSIAVAVIHFDTVWELDLSAYPWINYILLGIEVVMAVYLCFIGIKHRKYLVSVLSVSTAALMCWHELTAGHTTEGVGLRMDKLSLIMILVIGVIGGLICLYTVVYMRDYARHNPETPDRRVFFMTMLFVFLFAMFGLVLSESLIYLYFFWEVTTFCSYLLIGYTRTKKAEANAFGALTMNLLGGLALAIGVVLIARTQGVQTMDGLATLDSSGGIVAVAVFLIALSGLIKAAQMPFSSWLTGAMVAPTPSSALLHSSTMVKAGVYLIIRLSPLLGNTTVGKVVTLMGAFTFLATALLAVSQHDAKKVLAYSTISNLGLIIMCAGIGTSESLWTALMMIIFHACAKSLLFLAVGSADHRLGSHDTEDMDGLLRISPLLSMFIVIGIFGMFLAPFGMVISKWAAMKAVVDTGNVLLLLTLAFGSSVTLFFWTKWLGKLIANRRKPGKTLERLHMLERVPMLALSLLTVLTCMFFPLISKSTILPFLMRMRWAGAASPINTQDSNIILLMLSILFVLPVIVMEVFKYVRPKETLVYMSGENLGDNMSFRGSMGATQRIEARNWYMESLFGESVILKRCQWIAGIGLLLGLFIIAGGVLI